MWKIPKEEKVKENTKKQRKRGNNKHMSFDKMDTIPRSNREELRELFVDFYTCQSDGYDTT